MASVEAVLENPDYYANITPNVNQTAIVDLANAGLRYVNGVYLDSDGNEVTPAEAEDLIMSARDSRLKQNKGILRRLIIPILLLAVGGFLMSKKKTRIAGYVVGGLGAFSGVMAFLKK